MRGGVLRTLAVGKWNYLILEGEYFYEVYECWGDVCRVVLTADRAAGPMYYEAFDWAAELLGFGPSSAVEPSSEPPAYGPFQLVVPPTVTVLDGLYVTKVGGNGWALYRVDEVFYAAERSDDFFHVAVCEVVEEDHSRILHFTGGGEVDGDMGIFCETVLEVFPSKARRRYFDEMWRRVTTRRVWHRA